MDKLNFHRNKVQGTVGDYVARSERTRRMYVLHRLPCEWLLTVHAQIVCAGGVYTFDPNQEIDESQASDVKNALVAEANRRDAEVIA